jgi:hypothetical protein
MKAFSDRYLDETNEARAMSEDHPKAPRKRRAGKPSAPKYYSIGIDWARNRGAGYEFQNEEALKGGRQHLGPKLPARGFRENFPTPQLIMSKKIAPTPKDVTNVGTGYWLITGKVKSIFDLDPEACAFVKCDVVSTDDDPSKEYWLFDVVRQVEESRIKTSNADLTPYRLFRVSPPRVFCDRTIRDACKVAKVTGIVMNEWIYPAI